MENNDCIVNVADVVLSATDKTIAHYASRSDKQLARVSIRTFMKKFVDVLCDDIEKSCTDLGVEDDMSLSREVMADIRAGVELILKGDQTES